MAGNEHMKSRRYYSYKNWRVCVVFFWSEGLGAYVGAHTSHLTCWRDFAKAVRFCTNDETTGGMKTLNSQYNNQPFLVLKHNKKAFFDTTRDDHQKTKIPKPPRLPRNVSSDISANHSR